MQKPISDYPVVSTLKDTDKIPVNMVDETTGASQLSLTSFKTLKDAVNAAGKSYKTYTVALDFGDSNPETWATYEDDAVGMEAGAAAWDTFFGEYPCMLINGKEGVRLNPNNLAFDVNGSGVDITSGNDGDVMVKYPRRGVYIRKSGNIVRVSMTNAPEGTPGFENFQWNAHYYKGQKCSAFYRGVYKGSEVSSKLRSLSGKGPANTKTIGAFRTLAQANGSGYEQSVYWHILFRQCMYLLKYKGANAQVAVGRGFVDGHAAATDTGGANAKGADWGESTGNYQCKLFNEEDAWGNIWEWFDGLVTDASRNYLVNDPKKTTAFSDGGSGYVSAGSSTFSENTGGWISSVVGSNRGGFLINGKDGSETTYLCDYGVASASCVARFGGHWVNASHAGMFYVNVDAAASYSYAGIGGRLSFFEVDNDVE